MKADLLRHYGQAIIVRTCWMLERKHWCWTIPEASNDNPHPTGRCG